MAVEICRRFDKHLTVLAFRLALESAGSRIEISKAMMPITTSNSTKVNALCFRIESPAAAVLYKYHSSFAV
jgi:5,10-methylenetetrahydrofolate reductase